MRKESVLSKSRGEGDATASFTIINKETRLTDYTQRKIELSPYGCHEDPTTPETGNSEKASSENEFKHTFC